MSQHDNQAQSDSPHGHSKAKLEWNAAAWFGSLFGMALWMALAGLLALGRSTAAGATVLLLFVVTAGAGIQAWRRRECWSCYSALNGMLALVAATGSATIFVLDSAGLWEVVQSGSSLPAGPSYLVLGAVLLTLYVLMRTRFGAAENRTDG